MSDKSKDRVLLLAMILGTAVCAASLLCFFRPIPHAWPTLIAVLSALLTNIIHIFYQRLLKKKQFIAS